MGTRLYIYFIFFNKIFMFNISFTVDKQRLIEAAFDDGYFLINNTFELVF